MGLGRSTLVRQRAEQRDDVDGIGIGRGQRAAGVVADQVVPVEREAPGAVRRLAVGRRIVGDDRAPEDHCAARVLRLTAIDPEPDPDVADDGAALDAAPVLVQPEPAADPVDGAIAAHRDVGQFGVGLDAEPVAAVPFDRRALDYGGAERDDAAVADDPDPGRAAAVRSPAVVADRAVEHVHGAVAVDAGAAVALDPAAQDDDAAARAGDAVAVAADDRIRDQRAGINPAGVVGDLAAGDRRAALAGLEHVVVAAHHRSIEHHAAAVVADQQPSVVLERAVDEAEGAAVAQHARAAPRAPVAQPAAFERQPAEVGDHPAVVPRSARTDRQVARHQADPAPDVEDPRCAAAVDDRAFAPGAVDREVDRDVEVAGCPLVLLAESCQRIHARGRVMVFGPAARFPSWTAARSVHDPSAAAQTPSPSETSGASAWLSTTNCRASAPPASSAAIAAATNTIHVLAAGTSLMRR